MTKRKTSPRSGRSNAKQAEGMLVSLHQLRRTVTTFNQADVAERLAVTQGYVSKLERQDDMLLSKLYAYVEALGGVVEIRATFPDHVVRLVRLRRPTRLAPTNKQKAV